MAAARGVARRGEASPGATSRADDGTAVLSGLCGGELAYDQLISISQVGTSRSELVELLRRLVSIDSVNPSLVPGGAGEAAIARFVADWLTRAGLEVSVADAAPGRPNVIGIARGSGHGPTLLLNAHTDTVGVGGMEAPHEPRVENGCLFGRGSYDMKAGLAASMLAVASARGLAGDVVLAAVADEEVAGSGTKALLASGLGVDAAIVTEPTGLDVAIAHKGFVGFEIETAGRAAHGSLPERGIDAIARMGPVLVELAALAERLRSGEGHRLLGRSSLHASLIEGGRDYASYPERCLLTGEWRTLPGESPGEVEGALREVIARSGVDAELRLRFTGDPFEVDEEEEIVRLVHRHARTAVVGVPYWSDSALLAAAGIPTVLFGPRGGGAHERVEWVDLASLERLRDVLLAAANEYCRSA
jgi:acetylornithine deacetylase/succinyl-diaminopimelate desuccinylase-like protein